MPARPHALYVAWGFPPNRGPGVHRALATANELCARGFDVTVLTADRETFIRHTGIDTSLEERVHPDIRIERVPFAWPLAEGDLRTWPRERAKDPVGWADAYREREAEQFPEPTYGPWHDALLAAAEAVHRERPVQLTIASANPNVAFAAAHHLHVLDAVPYVLDHRDAWRIRLLDGTEIHPEGSRVAELETAYMAAAHEVWFVNEPIRLWHADRYPQVAERMHVVANGFDPEFAPTPRTSSRLDRPLTFGYIGTVSHHTPMSALVAGWQLARSQHSEMTSARAEIYGYLGYSSSQSHALQRLFDSDAAEGITYCGPVVKAALRSTYERFDALLLALPGGKYITGGKVYEYAASALPIVSIHEVEHCATQTLQGYPLWYATEDLTPEGVAAALGAAAADRHRWTAADHAACAEFAQTYARERQLRPRLAQLLHDVTQG